jgi:proline iminopeptidase
MAVLLGFSIQWPSFWKVFRGSRSGDWCFLAGSAFFSMGANITKFLPCCQLLYTLRMDETSDVKASGFLEADGHKIYWEDWGNPKSKPILYLHGGPGGGVANDDKDLFDPKLHRVIFHDQRGSGKSTPFAETKNNTTQDLVRDIEMLREHLGIEKMYVMGGSWGSTLSLVYAIAHPDRVERIALWGLFLARPFENDFVTEGYPRYFFPQEWERFISFVPQEHQKSGDDIMRYYADKLYSGDEAVAVKYAREWTLWESTLCSVVYDPVTLEKEIAEDANTVAIAKLETHYFLNKSFLSENHILDNLTTITHIPCALVQGRFDMCTPPISAWDVKKAYGENLSLRMINAGHFSTDPDMKEALRTMVAGLT